MFRLNAKLTVLVEGFSDRLRSVLIIAEPLTTGYLVGEGTSPVCRLHAQLMVCKQRHSRSELLCLCPTALPHGESITLALPNALCTVS